MVDKAIADVGYELMDMKRSEVTPHYQNPRKISDKARKKLKGIVEKHGFVHPFLTVNKRTGRVLGGHQRLSVLDDIHKFRDGKNDYTIHNVSVVDVDEVAERELLVLLNNPSTQGTWDVEVLAELNLEEGVNFEDMGFDRLDIDLLFDGDSRFTDIFKDSVEVQEAKNSLEEIKAHRAESTEKLKEQNSIEFYFVVVCRDAEEKQKILNAMKLPKHESYVSGESLSALISKRGTHD